MWLRAVAPSGIFDLEVWDADPRAPERMSNNYPGSAAAHDRGGQVEDFTLVVRTDESGARTIDETIRSAGGEPGIVTQLQHLSGDVATWMVAATVVAQSLPALLLAIKELVASRRVRTIEFNGVKIENPTNEMVVDLLSQRSEHGG